MPVDFAELKTDLESVFRRIAEMQIEPGDVRSENVLGAIEHMISMARYQRTVLEVERANGER